MTRILSIISAIPTIVRFFAVLVGIGAGIATIIVAIVVLTDGESDIDPETTPVIVRPPTPPVDPDPTFFPDFLVSDIKPCVMHPTTSSNPRRSFG